MRIPVYASNAVATSEAPGASIRARMDPNVFVQAELAKGEVLGSAFEQINKYALARAEAEAKIQYNEAMLGAEVEMRDLAESLKDSSRLGDVLNEKGTGAWQVATKDMRARLADGLSSRSMTDAFNARFDQQEVTVRFQLRDAVETRINARAAAASAARQESLVAELSNPSTPIEFALMKLTGQNAEDQANVTNGTATSDMKSATDVKIMGKIATNTTGAYVFDDPTRATALAEALDLQDEVNAGTMTAEDAYEKSGLDGDAAYTLFTLQMLPREQALEIIYDTLGKSTRLFEATEKQNERSQEKSDKLNADYFRAMFMFSDPNAQFTARDLINIAPRAAAMSGLTNSPDAPINPEQARAAFMKYFDNFNYLNIDQRKQIDAAFDTQTASSFAIKTNPDVFADLFGRAEAGSLTISGLNASRASTTQESYTQLLSKIGAASDDALNDVKSIIKLRFNYDENMALDTEGAQLAQSAYYAVAGELETLANQRISAGNPMTRAELSEKGRQLTEGQMDLFREQIRAERELYIGIKMADIPIVDPENALANLETWWKSLDDVQKKEYKMDYATHKVQLSDFMSRINR